MVWKTCENKIKIDRRAEDSQVKKKKKKKCVSQTQHGPMKIVASISAKAQARENIKRFMV